MGVFGKAVIYLANSASSIKAFFSAFVFQTFWKVNSLLRDPVVQRLVMPQVLKGPLINDRE